MPDRGSILGRWRSRPAEPSTVEPNDQHRSGVLAAPEDQAALDRWLTVLRAAGLSDSAVDDAVAGLQAEHTEPIPTVLLHLLSHDSRSEEWREEFATQLARFAGGDAARACRQVWKDYAHLRPLDPTGRDRLRSVRPSLVQLSFMTANPRFRRVRLPETTPPTNAGNPDLAPAVEWSAALPDVDVEPVRSFIEDFLVAPASTPARQYASETARAVVENYDRYIGYQDRAVRTGTLPCLDPLQPHVPPLEPFDGVVVFDRSVYSYAGTELVQFIAGGPCSRAVGIYLAARNVLIDFQADLPRVTSDRVMANLFAQLLTRLIRQPDAYDRALEPGQRTAAPKSIVLGVGRAQNFALHLWNYYPGLQRVVDAGLVDRVTELHSAGSEFFGPVHELFPEFGAAKVVRNGRQALWDPYPFSTDHLVLQAGGNFVTRAVLERVVRAMADTPVIDETAHQPLFPDDRPFPIVWIGMRVGSRSWWDQETQIPELVRRLQDRYPSALVLLDGFSAPVGQDEISGQWSSSIDQLRELAATVISACPQPERVLSMVGDTLRESVLWAVEADTFLTPIGTTEHKVGWFTPAPGAVYGPASMVDLGPAARRPGAWEADGITVPTYLVGKSIDRGERRRLNDRRDQLDNVRLDLDSLVETMCGLIERRREQLRG